MPGVYNMINCHCEIPDSGFPRLDKEPKKKIAKIGILIQSLIVLLDFFSY